MEEQHVAGFHRHGHALAEIAIDDFEVAAIGFRPPIRNMAMDGLPMRSRQYPQAAILERRPRQRDPHTHLRLPGEVEVERILVPRLADDAWILEDELALEAVEIRPEDLLH